MIPRTPPAQGLTEAEAERRLASSGPNEIIGRKRASALAAFLTRFKNPLVLILLAAAAISVSTGERASALIIVFIVLMSAFLDFLNTFKAEKAVQALQRRVMVTSTVIRDGRAREIPVAALVPGDLVSLKPGDLVPADGRLVRADDFFLNESSLTGESFPVERASGEDVFMGSSVETGEGWMETVSTGVATKFSAIAASLSKKEAPTDFDRGMKDFSLLVLKMTSALVVFVFFVNALVKHDLLESLLFSTALAVGLTPELLPMIVALNLSKGSLAMSRHGVIVKKLSAIQNFGSMDVLCTDKTGTLTEGKIVLLKHVDGYGRESEDVLEHAYLSSWYHSGFVNPFDTAVKEYRSIDVSSYAKIDEIPFDFVRKCESVVVEKDGRRRLIVKGAPEEVFSLCRSYGPERIPFDGRTRSETAATYLKLSREGFRVLALAVRDLADRREVYGKDDEREMTLLGFAAFFDPPKNTASETLRMLEASGIEIKIVTGDNDLVTRKIAADIGLPVKGVLLGEELQEMSDEALRVLVEEATIFARVNPIQKLRIISTLRKNGRVVGYVGDGINDAPSLREADVGISVDNAVDVAKASADLVLLKKSLRDLAQGVVEGRKTFANTLKYLMMSLGSNFGNMFSMAGAALFLPFLPMLPVQILFNNLLYDVAQFSIPLDRIDAEEIARPRKFDAAFVRKFMWIFGPVSSAFDFLTFWVLFTLFRSSGAVFQTGWFLESLATQTLVIHVIRTRKLPFFESRPSGALLFSTLAAVIIGWSVVVTPLGKHLGFMAPPAPVFAAIGAIVLGYLVTVQIVKQSFYGWIGRRLRTSQRLP